MKLASSIITHLLLYIPVASAGGYFVDTSDLIPWMYDFQRVSEKQGTLSADRNYAKYIGYLVAVHDDTSSAKCERRIEQIGQLGAIIAQALRQPGARLDLPADEFVSLELTKLYPCHGGWFFSGNKLLVEMREYQKYRRGERFDLASANEFIHFSLGMHDRYKYALCPGTKNLSENTVADTVAKGIEASPEKWDLPASLTAAMALMDGFGCGKKQE